MVGVTCNKLYNWFRIARAKPLTKWTDTQTMTLQPVPQKRIQKQIGRWECHLELWQIASKSPSTTCP